MSYTNLGMTWLAEQTANEFSRGFRNQNGLLKVAKKIILEPGKTAITTPIPGATASTTRTTGSAYTAAKPTDTAFTLTPATEYGYALGVDRLDQVANLYDIPKFYMGNILGSIFEGLSTALWALVPSLTTNVIGTLGTTPEIAILNTAYKKLMENKAWKNERWVAVVGPSEAEAWKTSASWSDLGPASQDAITTGSIQSKYGFDIYEDQDRYASGENALCVAMHPSALQVCFRSSLGPLGPGEVGGQATDPETGITFFTRAKNAADSTTGEGFNVQVFCVAAVGEAYDAFGVKIQSAS